MAVLVAMADTALLRRSPSRAIRRPRSACSLPTEVLGAPAPRTPPVELAARGSSASGIVDGGREILFAVRDPAGRTGVIRVSSPTPRSPRAWPGVLLAALGVALLGVSLLVADRLARSLVRATIDVAAVSHRLAHGDSTPGPTRTRRSRSEWWPPR